MQAESSTVELTVVVACHPGYTIGSDNTCVVRNEDNVVRRSTENRYIYIRVSVCGVWGGVCGGVGCVVMCGGSVGCTDCRCVWQ